MNNLISNQNLTILNDNYVLDEIKTVEECERALEIEYKRKEEFEQQGINLPKENIIPTIPSYEVAKMMERPHWKVLNMIEGKAGEVGIIKVLTDNDFVVSNYFIESEYKDASGKSNKCYECTKMGCELLANKMTGEKGILFSAKYVKKFNQMEKELESQSVDSYVIDNKIQRAER